MRHLVRLRALFALAVLVLVFSSLSPAFLTQANLVILAKHVALNAILALGMTFVILSGGIDLSVGSVAGLAGMTAGWLLHEGLVLRPLGVVVYFSVPSVIVIALAVGVLVGGINGLLVVRARVAPFIATLGTLYVARGAALLISGGATFPNLAGRADLGNTGFATLGTGTILGLPAPIWLMALLGAAFAFVASRTPFGRRVYAVGDNERAASLVGIRVGWMLALGWGLAAAIGSIAGMMVAPIIRAGQFALRIIGPAELPAPNHQCVCQQPPFAASSRPCRARETAAAQAGLPCPPLPPRGPRGLRRTAPAGPP